MLGLVNRKPSARAAVGPGRLLERLTGTFRRQWFILGIFGSILLAHRAPETARKDTSLGWLIDNVAVMVIFFCSGLSLNAAELKKAAGQVRLHLLVQGYSLLVIPACTQILTGLLTGVVCVSGTCSSAFRALMQGLRVVACMPPPVSSAVILTSVVGGNEAAAIFNSTVGSLLGILVTPLLLILTTGAGADGSGGSVPLGVVLGSLSFLAGGIFVKIGGSVLLPLLLGLAVHAVAAADPRLQWALRLPFGQLNKLLLIAIIYAVFCNTFSSRIDMSPQLVAASGVLVILMQLGFSHLLWRIALRPRLRFSKADVVAVLFAGTHKSLTLGIPLINILFADDPQMSWLSLPLLLYHPLQVVMGSAIADRLAGWVKS